MAVSDNGSSCNYYELLAVSPRATVAQLRKAYLAAALSSHPDQSKDNTNSKTERFHQIQEAWEVLRDARKRAEYDSRLQFAQGRLEAIPVNEEIDLSAMATATNHEGQSEYTYPCRCGGEYILLEGDVPDVAAAAVLQCESCSLYIRVAMSR
eukprot:jgi/Chlat1/1657/Chrsp127S01901